MRIAAIHAYLKAKGYTGELKNADIEAVDLPEPQNDKKMQAFAYLNLGFWTQQEIAEKLGVTQQTISKWKNNINPESRLRHHCPQIQPKILIKDLNCKFCESSRNYKQKEKNRDI